MSTPRRWPLVPERLLARFADEGGQVLMERRDRSRRHVAPVAQAAAEAGVYGPAPGERAVRLAALLDAVEAEAGPLLDALVEGPFPPRGAARARLALWAAVHLLLGRGWRAQLVQRAAELASVVEPHVPEDEAETSPAAPAGEPAHVVVRAPGEDPARVRLDGLPAVARLLAARTWQLVRFPRPLLLTGDTPVVPWAPSAAPWARLGGLAAAEEVRIPLDPCHALILARRATAGEVTRELGERHAAALNRTVAEAARVWMYYHPASDPLFGIELAPP